jgi:hypothetical protein
MPKVVKGKAQQDDPLREAAPMTGIEAGTEEEEQQHAEGAATGEQAGPKPKFPPLTSYEQNGKKIEFRRVPVPQHRMTPLKNNWLALYKPVTENLKLDMRMNLKTKKVGPLGGWGAAWWRRGACGAGGRGGAGGCGAAAALPPARTGTALCRHWGPEEPRRPECGQVPSSNPLPTATIAATRCPHRRRLR